MKGKSEIIFGASNHDAVLIGITFIRGLNCVDSKLTIVRAVTADQPHLLATGAVRHCLSLTSCLREGTGKLI
jgi:hypothetical protein